MGLFFKRLGISSSLGILVLLGVLASCNSTPGYYPLYASESECVAVQELVGRWRSVDKENQLVFSQGGSPAAYRLEVSERNAKDRAWFEVFAVPIGDKVYLDFYPDMQRFNQVSGFPRKRLEGNLFLFQSLQPLHRYAQLSWRGDSLQLGFVYLERRDSLDSAHPDYLPWLKGETPLLIASAHQLKSYLLRHPEASMPAKEQLVLVKRKGR